MRHLAFAILLSSVFASPAGALPVYLDNFEQFTVGADGKIPLAALRRSLISQLAWARIISDAF